MPKRAASSSAPTARSSKRTRAVPRRFVPGGSADVPSEFEEMVHSIALEACKASPLPLDCEAVQTLEQALLQLEPGLQRERVGAVRAVDAERDVDAVRRDAHGREDPHRTGDVVVFGAYQWAAGVRHAELRERSMELPDGLPRSADGRPPPHEELLAARVQLHKDRNAELT